MRRPCDSGLGPLALLFLAALASPVAAEPLTVLIEGGHGGVSEPLPALPVAGAVSEALGDDWTRTTADFGVLRTGDGWVLQRSAGMAGLASAPAEPAPPSPLPLLLADDWFAFVWPADAAGDVLPTLAGLAPEARVVDGVGSRTDDTLTVATSAALPPLPAPLVDGEARLQLVHRRADGAEVTLVSRAVGEGARRVALQRSAGEGALRLGAGDLVEGRSFLAGQSLSLQRDVSWGTFRREGLDALVPGHNELVGGLENLREEAATAGVALVSSNLYAGDAPAVAPYLRLERGGRSVLVLGWTDPAALLGLSVAERTGLTVRGADAVRVALDTARATHGGADLVVLIGLGGPLPDLPGVDVALTDFGGRRRAPVRWSTPPEALAERSTVPAGLRDPIPTPRLGPALLGALTVDWGEDGALSRLDLAVLPVSEDAPPDPETRREVQEVRQPVYVDREATLVPAPGRLPPPPGWRKGAVLGDQLGPAGFALLAGNLVIDRTGADIAMLPPLPQPLELDGDRSELTVDASLSLIDDVVRVAMTGLELRQIILSFPFVQATPGSPAPGPDGAWIVGAEATASPKWRGSKLADGQQILVAIASGLLDDPRIASFVTRAHVVRTWTGTGWARRPSPSGARWPLRELVRDGLVMLRERDPTFGTVYARRGVPLAAELSGRVPSRLEIEIDDLNLGVSGSLAFAPDTGYESSNEARAKLANSVAAAARGRLALRWSDRIGQIEGFADASYSGTRVAGGEKPIELADDLLAGVQLQLRLGGAGQRIMGVPLSAFLQGVFDTEWTRADDPDDPTSKLARQQLLRTSAGINLGKVGVLKDAWFGGFVEADLAVSTGIFSPGLTAGLRTEKIWGALRWSNLLDVRGYFATPEDTEADLSLRANLRTDLIVAPLRKWLPGLGLGGFVDALVFRGSVPGLNQTPGLHLLIGAELSYDSVIRPPVRLR